MVSHPSAAPPVLPLPGASESDPTPALVPNITSPLPNSDMLDKPVSATTPDNSLGVEEASNSTQLAEGDSAQQQGLNGHQALPQGANGHQALIQPAIAAPQGVGEESGYSSQVIADDIDLGSPGDWAKSPPVLVPKSIREEARDRRESVDLLNLGKTPPHSSQVRRRRKVKVRKF